MPVLIYDNDSTTTNWSAYGIASPSPDGTMVKKTRLAILETEGERAGKFIYRDLDLLHNVYLEYLRNTASSGLIDLSKANIPIIALRHADDDAAAPSTGGGVLRPDAKSQRLYGALAL